MIQGPLPRAVAPDLDVAEVDGFHGAVAVVVAVGLGVAVVEAAAAVVVGAVEDGVHALGVVAGGDAVGVVVAVAGAGGDVDAVGLVAADGGGGGGGVGEVVGAACGAAGRGLGEVVAAAGLVVDHGDHADGAGAERVLRGGVGVPARAEHADVLGGVVRGAPDLVQRAVVRGVQRAGRAVRGHTRRTTAGVDVTRQRTSSLSGARRHSGTSQHARHERDRGCRTREHLQPRAARKRERTGRRRFRCPGRSTAVPCCRQQPEAAPMGTSCTCDSHPFSLRVGAQRIPGRVDCER